VWYVKSSLSCEQAAKNVWAAMDANDTLIVIDSTTNNAYWYNLPDDVSKKMQEQWYK
jgi:hypothetical protein